MFESALAEYSDRNNGAASTKDRDERNCPDGIAEQRRSDGKQDVAAVPEHVAGETPDPPRLRAGLSQWVSGSCDPLSIFR